MQSPTPPIASAAPRQAKATKAFWRNKLGGGATVPLSRYITFFSIVIVGCAIDLWTKHAMFSWRGLPPPWRHSGTPHAPWWLWKNVFGIETALNQGALFGMGQGKVWLFAILSVFAAAGIVYWLFGARAARDGFFTVALGLVMAGILGNLYDRLGLWANPTGKTIYAVRDWILISYGGYEFDLLGRKWASWPNFNIADSMLVCGAVLIVCHAVFAKPKDESSPSSAEGEEKN